MESPIPDKSYFRIGEVSRILGVEPYVIRYWESEFRIIRPERTSSAQRLYRRKDLETLAVVKDLLHREHYTIRGAKRQLAMRLARKPESAEPLLRQRLAELKDGLLRIKRIVG